MSRTAFTLVELSIVLVILGLLVGGVLSGQSLIRAAELRSALTERDKYFTAVNAFRDKYLALPGDMPNAFDFWQSAGVAGCNDATVNTSAGCNGNGDGRIMSFEPYKVWMHLSLAGLIEGSYDGTGTGVSQPSAKLDNGTWQAGNNIYDVDTPDLSISNNTLYFFLDGAGSPLPSLTQGEAWSLDKKADDGFSKTGSMRGVTTVGSGDQSAQDGACYDQHLNGDPSNPRSDPYGISSNAARTGECILAFEYQK